MYTATYMYTYVPAVTEFKHVICGLFGGDFNWEVW